jgi:uncharacterized membrane protein HdeD (DUF308 family)
MEQTKMTDAALNRIGMPKLEAIRSNWGWFVALGVAMLVIGFIALGSLVVATVATVWFYGILLIVAGVAEIIHAFRAMTWGKMILELLAGVLYAAAGVICIMNPLLASAVLTLMLGVSLIVVGVFRVMAGFDVKPATGWGWIVAGGVMTVILGILITLSWPGASLWVLGMFLGIDLVMQGVAWIALGLACRKGLPTAAAATSVRR